jgi:hypothetical protein
MAISCRYESFRGPLRPLAILRKLPAESRRETSTRCLTVRLFVSREIGEHRVAALRMAWGGDYEPWRHRDGKASPVGPTVVPIRSELPGAQQRPKQR